MVRPGSAPARLFLIAALVLSGCSDPYAGRMAVSGNVTLEDQPLDGGTISFDPMDKGMDTRGQVEVTNGRYTIPREKGLKPGKYLVRLTAGDGKTPANEDAGAPGGSTNIISVDRVPEDWNVNSRHEVEVKADGPNTFDFPIPKANPKARKR